MTTITKPKSTFHKFLSIFHLDKFMNVSQTNSDMNVSQTNSDTDSKLAIIKNADFLLNTENYEVYAEMLSKGYIPTQQQQQRMDTYINNILSSHCFNTEPYVFLETLLEKGLKLNYSNVCSFLCNEKNKSHNACGITGNTDLFHNPNYIIQVKKTCYTDGNNKEKLFTFPLLTKNIRNTLSENAFSDYLFKNFENYLIRVEGKQTMYTYTELLVHSPEIIFKNVDFEKMKKIVQQLHYFDKSDSYSIEHKKALLKIVNTTYNHDINKLLNDTQITYSTNLVKNLAIENIKNGEYSTELPQQANQIIEDIESLYFKIKSSNYTNEDNMNHLNILLEKRIPDVVSKYLKLDCEYRTSLVSSQGKNAQELMIESLNNIKILFDNVYDNINQDIVDSLSATHRYTKTLKIK